MNSPSQDVERGWIGPLLVFQLVYLVSYIDRQILSAVVAPVRSDLGLSDTQIGLLQGFAFSLVLAFSALLTARRVDSGNRIRILSVCVILWCVMTIACGFARNFWMLLLARTGIAIAEAVVPVAVLSILSDMVPRRLLPRAGALFMAGPYIGGGLAWLLSGSLLAALEPWRGVSLPLLGEFQPWRGLFWLIGAPGILLGVGMLMFMREPPRREANRDDQGELMPVGGFLRQHAGFLFILMTFLSFLNVINMAIYGWTPSFMMRVHGMDAATTGTIVGPLFIVSGVAGSVLGSWLMGGGDVDRLLSHVIRMMVWLMALFTVPLALAPFVAPWQLSLGLLVLGCFFLSAVMTSSLMPVQLLAPGPVRGRVTAICAIYSGGLGGLGPYFVGALSDHVFIAPQAFGSALGVCFILALLVAWATGPWALRQARRLEAAK
jgi:MFS transporter, Spinster family, sphingosine-1-phosphate transporter